MIGYLSSTINPKDQPFSVKRPTLVTTTLPLSAGEITAHGVFTATVISLLEAFYEQLAPLPRSLNALVFGHFLAFVSVNTRASVTAIQCICNFLFPMFNTPSQSAT